MPFHLAKANYLWYEFSDLQGVDCTLNVIPILRNLKRHTLQPIWKIAGVTDVNGYFSSIIAILIKRSRSLDSGYTVYFYGSPDALCPLFTGFSIHFYGKCNCIYSNAMNLESKIVYFP